MSEFIKVDLTEEEKKKAREKLKIKYFENIAMEKSAEFIEANPNVRFYNWQIDYSTNRIYIHFYDEDNRESKVYVKVQWRDE